MELIPVFAFIVLVASIVTFIFSIAAYVLYKIREKKGRFVTKTNPSAFKAELITPNYYYLPENQGFNQAFGNNHSQNTEPQLQPNFAGKNYADDNNQTDKNYGNELVWR